MSEENNQKKDVSVAEWLPELTEEDVDGARGEIEWAKWFISLYRPGDFHTIPNGVTLQAINFDTVRCVRVFDDPRAWWWLSMLKVSFEGAGITLELDPYTIVTRRAENAEGKRDAAAENLPDEDETSRDLGAVGNLPGENFGMEVA